MAVRAEAVPYGAAAVERLAERVHAAKAGDPLAGVTVVVASNAVAVAARRALASRPGGLANVTFLTLHRLAERLAAPALAAAGRRPVSPPVLAGAVRSVLRADPGVFEPVADHPATEQALVAAHRELRTAPDEALDPVADCSTRAADVVRIHREVRERIEPEWFDEQDLLVAAAGVLRSQGAEALGPVVLHLLQEVTAGDAHLLRALTEVGDVDALVGVTGDAAADDPVLTAHARAGITVGTDGVQQSGASRIVSTSDPDDEVRAAIRLVEGWMRDDVPLGRVALLYGSADPYRRLLHEQLAAAGIPVNGSPVTPVGDQLLGRTLRALLALPDRGYRRTDVLAVLTGAPVLDGDGRAPSRAWERISRLAGVVGGPDWDSRLAVFATENRRRAKEADDDDLERKAEHLRRDADRADDLTGFVRALQEQVDKGTAIRTWAELVEWAHGLIRTYLGTERHRVTWPDHEQRAAERVEAALDRLAGLDRLDGPAPTVEVFRRTLEAELDASLRRVGRMGEGVLVGHVATAAGLVLDRVAVLGLAEGSFPPRRLEDSLLPDAERAEAAGELALRLDRLHHDHRHLLAAVAAADEAVLCAPRGDLRRSGERPASRWLLDDAIRLAEVEHLRSADLRCWHDADWLEYVPSFAGGLAALAVPATRQELRLAAVARRQTDDPLLDDPVLVAASEVVRARRSGGFTRFDGNVTSVVRPPSGAPRFSATRLQTWAECPHAYFGQYVLRVEPVEEPERRLSIDPVDKGSLVHEVLDRFVKLLIKGRAGDDQLMAVYEDVCADFEDRGLTGRPMLWRAEKERIRAELRTFLREDEARRAGGLRPLCTEQRFSDLLVSLPTAGSIRVGGSIDRVDQQPDGALVVLDYKTGSARDYDKVSKDDPHVGGTHLQPYLYFRAAVAELGMVAPVWAGFWFTSTKGEFKWKGYWMTPEVVDSVEGALDVIVDGIARGIFPARPSETPAWKWVDCWYCTPDGLSGAERRREWDAKRRDPSLRRYLELAEPEALDDAH